MTQNALLDRIYEERKVADADGVERDPFPDSSPRAVTDALHGVVRDLDARSTLEVGLAYGLATLAICQPHLERGTGRHIAVDPNQDGQWKSIGKLNIERAGLADHFEHIADVSERALPKLWLDGHRLDFAFIDGLHLFDHCLIDFFYIDRMLEPGGVVAFDDVWMPAMRRVVAFARTNRAYESMEVTSTAEGGLGKGALRVGKRLRQAAGEGALDRSGYLVANTNVAFLRKVRNDDRKWDYHAPF